jgi:hypothetical protein
VVKHIAQLRHPRVVRASLAEALERSVERETDRMEFGVSGHRATLAGDAATDTHMQPEPRRALN